MRSVLVIMDNFAPQNNCGSIPNTKLIKYLAREDVKITLITKEITPNMNLDQNLVPDEMDRIRTIRVGYSNLFSKTVEASRNKITDNGLKLKMKAESRPVRARIVSMLKRTYFWSRNRDWVARASSFVEKELVGQHFDCLYSSYPERMVHMLAEKLMDKGIADRWVADFRDPMFYDYFDAYSQNKAKRKQHAIERKADHVTIVSEDVLEKFLCDQVPQSKITYIPNGYDPEDFLQVPQNAQKQENKFRIFYAGTLYAGKRDFTVLFRALSELSAEGEIDISKVSIEYAGNEWLVMQGLAEKFDLLHCCTNYGFVTRTRVMEILSQVDCSAVCTHNTKTDKGVVTGKVFELLMMKKPIIAVVNGDEPNSELGKIVRQCNAGIVFEQCTEEEDYPALKQWLLSAYEQKMRTGRVQATLNETAREQYSYASIAKRLYSIMCK